MISVYTKYSDLSDKSIVWDNEAAFVFTNVEGNPISRKIISEIDKGTYVDKSSFIDRFGYKVYMSNLSTGSKTLLNIMCNPEKIFYAGELGDNAIELLPAVKNGKIFIENTERLGLILDSEDVEVTA